jgi:histidinol-phosphatase
MAALERGEALSTELAFALDVCERAGKIALAYYNSGVDVVQKSDGTPVTAADKECERLIREAINEKFPTDAILGEEEGESAGVAGKSTKRRRWILDPIDGTFGFARGIPVWATLLALEEDDEVILGVVCAPAVGDMYWAQNGLGAFKNGKRIHVSRCDKLSNAQFEFGGINRVLKLGYYPGFTRLVELTARQRGFGDYLGFAHVFEGVAEAHLEVGVHPWDLAPMKIIVEEAGGEYSDLEGGKSIYKRSCLVSNGLLHKEFLQELLRDRHA